MHAGAGGGGGGWGCGGSDSEVDSLDGCYVSSRETGGVGVSEWVGFKWGDGIKGLGWAGVCGWAGGDVKSDQWLQQHKERTEGMSPSVPVSIYECLKRNGSEDRVRRGRW